MLWRNDTNLNETLQSLLEKAKTMDVNANLTDIKNMYPLRWIIPITVVYTIIFITGVLGNISTCIVIARNKSMHTATNYYLFSLAISDLFLLISALLPEMYTIWSPENYIFGQTFCVIQGFVAETSVNATVLTITAFTVERYVAICHPFLSHTIAKLSRIVKLIIAIWVAALCLAIPQAIQFGVEYGIRNDVEMSFCSVVTEGLFQHSFEISTFIFFIGPMILITVLYVLIALRLRKSGRQCRISRSKKSSVAQKKVVKMLVAVVTAFFVCWAPFHAQRLVAIYLSSATPEVQERTFDAYVALIHISGVLYFLSATINPLLYNILSNKFREAFKHCTDASAWVFPQGCNNQILSRTYENIKRSCLPIARATSSCLSPKTTIAQLCSKRHEMDINHTKYSALSKYPPSLRTYQRSVSDGVQNMRISSEKPVAAPRSAPTSRHSSQAIFRPRLQSQTSQSTVLTNITRSLSSDAKTKTENILLPIPSIKMDPKGITNTNGKKQPANFWEKWATFFKFDYLKQEDALSKIDSVENANTISNSSLQDMDEMEFSSSDLVKYMEEVNEEIG